MLSSETTTIFGVVMENNEEVESYTNKDFAKDLGKAVVLGTAQTVAVYATLAAIGVGVIKVMELREKRAAKKNQEK
jgi:hypothetical protein